MPALWESVAERKQAQRDALIPKAWRLKSLPPPEQLNVMDVPRSCGILTEKEVDITENYDATALAQAIKDKKFSCVDVTTAYCKRAAIAQQLTNCLTEILFESALKRAANLDHHIAQHGTTIGPLHGVPISIKDSFKVVGYDASLGIANLCFKPAMDTALLVNLLLSAGAVIYCKTNIPQTLSTLDSVNHIFGRTLNPQNRLLTAGGSSGGEGALVAMRGSPLGIGTDIGGSIRVPAMCNGLYGFKPSYNRIPYGGQATFGPPGTMGTGLVPSAGPIARSVRDCELLLRTVADAMPWQKDPQLIPGVWNSSSFDLRVNPSAPKFKIGVLTTDYLVTPLPPIANLLTEVSRVLGADPSITIVPITPNPMLATAQALAGKLMSLDGANSIFDQLETHGEPLIPWLNGRMRRRPRATLEEIYKLTAEKEWLCAELARTLWRTPTGEEVDAIICPVAPHPTPKIDSWVGVGYTIDWVLTDYPAGVIPVREFEERDLDGEIAEEDRKSPRSSWDRHTQALWPRDKAARRHYVGTWLCVQVLAPRLQERRLVRCMEAIDRVLKTDGKGAKESAKL